MYCGHVVLFDFPRDPSEYVRRVGRTARGAGGTGVVTALVMGRQVSWWSCEPVCRADLVPTTCGVACVPPCSSESCLHTPVYPEARASPHAPSSQVPLARDIIGDNAKGKPVHRLPQI